MRGSLSQPPHKILRPEVSIPFDYLHGLVPRDSRHLHSFNTVFREPTGRLVAQVVEGQALDAGGLAA